MGPARREARIRGSSPDTVQPCHSPLCDINVEGEGPNLSGSGTVGSYPAETGARGAGWTIRLREKGGKEHAMPCYPPLAEALRAYINAARVAEEPQGWLFRTPPPWLA